MKKIITLLLVFVTANLFAQFNGKPIYEITTTQLGDTIGSIKVELYPTIAPNHVANFDSIVNAPINFDNRAFHRIIVDFMIQGGDPNSISGPVSTWGQGNSSERTVNAEFSPVSHLRGRLSAARSTDINSASSQFFICHKNSTHLDGNYSVYGNVVEGIETVDSIVVKPTNSNDLPNDKISMFIKYLSTDTSSAKYAPTLVSPADNLSDVQKSQIYEWTKADSNDFLTYKIQFSEDINFSSITFQKDIDTATNTITNIENEQGFNSFYWRVCSNNGGNLSCSNSRKIATYIAPPIRLSPAFEEINAETEQMFVWNKNSDADKYHLQVSKNPNFLFSSQIVIDTIISDTFFVADSLKMNSKFYWRINSIKNNKEGDFTENWYFVVARHTGISTSFSDNIITIFPNPTHNILNISLENNEKIYIQLVNSIGQIILEEVLKPKNKLASYNLSTIEKGIYILSIFQNDEKLYSGRLVIEK